MNDVDALIHLLTFDTELERPLLELINNSKKSEFVLYADHFKYDPVKKDILKGNKYIWNPNDRLWFKKINPDELEQEKDWLTATIYEQEFKGRVEEIIPSNKYKL